MPLHMTIGKNCVNCMWYLIGDHMHSLSECTAEYAASFHLTAADSRQNYWLLLICTVLGQPCMAETVVSDNSFWDTQVDVKNGFWTVQWIVCAPLKLQMGRLCYFLMVYFH